MRVRRPSTPAPRRRAAASRGFSLLEVVAVIALVALVTTSLAVALSGGMDGVRLRGAVKDVAAQLRFARVRAIVSGQPQDFVIDVDTRSWRSAGERSGSLPSALTVSATGAREVQPAEGQAAIRFYPDGSATGGRIELARGQARWQIDVAWLTGEVALVRGDEP